MAPCGLVLIPKKEMNYANMATRQKMEEEYSKAQTDVTTKQQPDEPYQSILEAAYKQIYEIGSNTEGWTNVKTDLGVKTSKKTVQVPYVQSEIPLFPVSFSFLLV